MNSNFVCMSFNYGECSERHATCIGQEECWLKELKGPCINCAFWSPDNPGCTGCKYEEIKKAGKHNEMKTIKEVIEHA